MKIRCNDCMSVFDEKHIEYDEISGQESCPCCGRIGCLMDVSEDEFPQYYNHMPIENN